MREFYDSILQNVRTGIAVMNGRDFRYVYVNPAYQDIIPEVKMVGKTFPEVFPGAVEKGAEDILTRALETGKPDAVWDGQVFRFNLSTQNDELYF